MAGEIREAITVASRRARCPFGDDDHLSRAYGVPVAVDLDRPMTVDAHD